MTGAVAKRATASAPGRCSSAVCWRAIPAVLARAALRAGAIAPLDAAALRLVAAALVLLPLLPSLLHRPQGPRPLGRRWPLGVLATLLGTTAGIALQQTALLHLPGALAVALLATAPVMALPLATLCLLYTSPSPRDS